MSCIWTGYRCPVHDITETDIRSVGSWVVNDRQQLCGVRNFVSQNLPCTVHPFVFASGEASPNWVAQPARCRASDRMIAAALGSAGAGSVRKSFHWPQRHGWLPEKYLNREELCIQLSLRGIYVPLLTVIRLFVFAVLDKLSREYIWFKLLPWDKVIVLSGYFTFALGPWSIWNRKSFGFEKMFKAIRFE